MITRPFWARIGAAFCAALAVLLSGGRSLAADGDALRVETGRLTGAAGAVDVGGALRPAVEYAVDGAREVRLAGPRGTTLRALPGTRLTVVGLDADRVAVKLVAGVLGDVTSASGYVDVATPAGVLRADRGVVYARVVNRNVYVEHQAGSTGTAGLFAPGSAAVGLSPGTFRMMALDAGDPMPSKTPVVLPTAPPAATTAPLAVGTPTGAAPARATALAAEAPPTVPYDPSCGPNPCAEYTPPPPCAPPPCAPPPVCGGCGEAIRHSGVPVPVRADDTGRSPLGTALGGDACNPNGVCACHCGKVPYVHYVEGLECDVSTYRVGNALVTVRPASRVRVHRLPDGSLQLWGPNLGCDLALIEVNDNQFGYIGDDGFLVINCLGQFEYFRGLVHLYPKHDTPYRQTNPPRRVRETSETGIEEVPLQGNVR